MLDWIERMEDLNEIAKALAVQADQWETLKDPGKSPAKWLMERGIKRKDIADLRRGAKVELHLIHFAQIDLCVAYNTMGGRVL